MGRTTLVVVLALGIAAGCSTGIQLTERGARVEEMSLADTTGGCHLVGDVAIGIPPDAARPRTEEQLLVLMRNKAGEMGANHVVVESREQRTEGGVQHWVGRGSAYNCEPGAAPAAPAEGTSGGEGGQATDSESALDAQ